MRAWFEPLVGQTWTTVAVFGLWTLTVLIVLLAAMWAFRRFSGVNLGRISRGRVPRLALVDAMAIDGRRRLVLVRRDNVEHLVLIGGPTDTVIETAIQRPQLRRQQDRSAARDQGVIEPDVPPPQPDRISPAGDLQSPPPPVATAVLPIQIGAAPIIARPPPAAATLGEFQEPVVPLAPADPLTGPEANLPAAPPDQPSETAATSGPPDGPAGESEAPLDLPSPPLSAPVAPVQDEADAAPPSEVSNQTPQSQEAGPRPGEEAARENTDEPAGTADRQATPATEARVDDLEREMARLLGEKAPPPQD
ncbi:MAG: hypothetical protein ACTSP2_02430 [Alphaproteobacteria bacterium]